MQNLSLKPLVLLSSCKAGAELVLSIKLALQDCVCMCVHVQCHTGGYGVWLFCLLRRTQLHNFIFVVLVADFNGGFG